jgi:GH24 family phage-related lysozyme (muramidase)
LFDGEVVEIGYQFNPKTQRGYGNYVVVRSEDPVNGEQFDALYAHIPKNAIYVNKGDQLKVGDKIGRMGTDDDDITDIGSINGTHMSVDFLKVGSSEPYPHWRTNIVPLVDTKFSTAKLKSKNFNPDLKTTTMKMLGAYENIKLEAYDDGTGVWTIGFGATKIRDKETGKMRDVRPGDTITEKEAFAMKDADYIRHYNIAEKELNAQGLSLSDLPVNVAAPLISLAFNYGSLRGAHKGSTSKWMINGKEVTFPNSLPVMVKNAYATGDYSKIANLLEFNLSQDMPDLPGLGERRKSEAQIIRSGSGTGYYNLQDLDLLPPSPPSTKNLLTSKLDYDSKEVEELFDKINTAGQPIIMLNTQVITNSIEDVRISRVNIDDDWKNKYRIASLGN